MLMRTAVALFLVAVAWSASAQTTQDQAPKSGTLRAQKLGPEFCETGCGILCGNWETIASAVCIADTPMQPHVKSSDDGKWTSARCGPSKGMAVICVAN